MGCRTVDAGTGFGVLCAVFWGLSTVAAASEHTPKTIGVLVLLATLSGLVRGVPKP